MKLTKQTAAVAVGTAAVLIWVVVKSWSGVPVNTDSISSWLVVAVAVGSIYAIAASGLVVTYTTSGIFNFAQGAIGMFMAFVYWELRFNHGLPAPLALILSVLVLAPLLGVLLERSIMRFLTGASLVVQIVVTVAVMLFFMGLASTIWDPTESRSIPFFFDSSGPAFTVGTTNVPWHRVITIVVAVVIALTLRLLLYRTRIGVTMRAVVDNRSLAGLHGARPEAASMLAWALGSSMAAVSGILLAPELGLQVDALTLLIINAFAAAIIGRLKSLPMTYVGGLLIGLVVYFATTFLVFTGRFSAIQPNYVFPIAILFAALLVLPQARIELRRLAPNPKLHQPRVRSVWETALGMAAVFGVVWWISRDMDPVNLNRVTLTIVIATLMLSLIPLTGWAGQVSLAQITFAGAGAFAMYQWAPFGSGSPVALVVAAAFAVPFGLLMALPAARLQGLYLALASMAFAVIAESLFFGQPEVFGNGAQPVPRFSIFGYRFTDQRAFLLLVTGIFGALAMLVVWVRRSRYGRRLIALRDSEAACATLGVNRLTSKLSVYALSAAMAGFAGALLGMQRGTAATQDYTMLAGIPIVLLAVVGGVETVSGALIGGILFEGFVWIQESFEPSWFTVIEYVEFGLIAIFIALTIDRIRRDARVVPFSTALRAQAVTLGALVAAVPVVILLTSFLRGNYDPSWLQALTRLGPGFLALSVALRPNGSSVELGFLFAPLLPWRRDARAEFMAEIRGRLRIGAPPPPPAPPGAPGEPVAEPVPAGVSSGETHPATSVPTDQRKAPT